MYEAKKEGIGVHANFVAALVILKDGKRVGWKVSRGADVRWMHTGVNSRHYSGFDQDECTHVVRECVGPEAFEEGEEWCASFPAHPDEAGSPPKEAK